ncbi:MAG: exosortase system-associated protein, TIGR04073 family [Mariprofundaceae bacterium]|nr:exosortase system-associated protein, TIGR04073 family [Mariprofundaceae bacterium]
MFKRLLLTSMPVLLTGVFAFGATAFADDYGSQAATKFSRGIINLTTGWLEVPKNISNESRKSNAGVGLTYGTVKGSVHTVGRTAAGALDTATFFVPSESFVHSDQVWNDYNTETTYGTSK